MPAYLELLESGILEERVNHAKRGLSPCRVCPHQCEVDRLQGELGICQTGEFARVSSYGPHLGEEDPLRGWNGSGTIFFSRCNLQCQYCQNADISQRSTGEVVSARRLARIMLSLQERGCHNINFVSPTHVTPQILEAVLIAAQQGLRVPLVYNTGGYDSQAMLKILSGVIDIYMPDMKYAEAAVAERYSKIPNYPQMNQAAVKEMHRQVGDLQLDGRGIATRGLLVRHLILPDGLAGTGQILRFLAREISPNTYINLMDQYRPAYSASYYPKLTRRISPSEFQEAVDLAAKEGLGRLDERKSRLWGW